MNRDSFIRRTAARALPVSLCAGLWLFSTSSPAGSLPDSRVSETRLRVEGRVREVLTLDVDDDARRELIVLSVSGGSRAPRRLFSVFWLDHKEQFADRPDLIWELPPTVMALDLFPPESDTAGPGGIYSLRQDGVYLQTFARSAAVGSRLVLPRSFEHLVPDDDTITLLDFAGPWSGAGTDLLIAGFPHPTLFRAREGGSYGTGIVLPAAAAASYRTKRSSTSLGASYDFPAPAPRTRPGGLREILFYGNEQMTVCDPWSSSAESTPPDQVIAEARVYPVEILSEEEAESDRTTVRTFLEDLDGDGGPDLVALVYRETGVLELAGRIMVFRAQADGSFPARADQVLQVDDGLYYLAVIRDLDGDGKAEIVVPSTRLGLWGYLRALTSHKVSFSAVTLTLGTNDRYDVETASRDPFTLRLSRSFRIPAMAHADLDGDGLDDIVLGRGENRVCVHKGVAVAKAQRFSSKPSACFAANPYDRYRHGKLRGRREVLMSFPVLGDERNLVTVFSLHE